MKEYLNARNFPCTSTEGETQLAEELESILTEDFQGNMLPLLGKYQRILSDNRRRSLWDDIFDKLNILFLCGCHAVLDGPMIGVSMAIRDSDYFRSTARMFGRDRSAIAALEMMATCWNETFANTGIWMGKTFEPASREIAASITGNDPETLQWYSAATTRVGRNFFRKPPNASLLQNLGLPVLTKLWRLTPRPMETTSPGSLGKLLAENLEKEKNIPYSMTGGFFLAQPGSSVVPEMKGKAVYQLNYRWPALEPTYPMTRLVDELVQIAEGVYLGQLVMATRHYSLGAFRTAVPGLEQMRWEIGEPYSPCQEKIDYGYQNNGFFLMIDPAFAREAYDDEAFPDLRPASGESGYAELGYDQPVR